MSEYWQSISIDGFIKRLQDNRRILGKDPMRVGVLMQYLLEFCATSDKNSAEFDEEDREDCIESIETFLESSFEFRRNAFFKGVMDGSIKPSDPEQRLAAYLHQNLLPNQPVDEWDSEKVTLHASALRSISYQQFLATQYWKIVRDVILFRSSYRCQLCNKQGGLHVHHKTYQHRGSEWLHMEDLICLCGPCHGKFHDKLPKGSE